MRRISKRLESKSLFLACYSMRDEEYVTVLRECESIVNVIYIDKSRFDRLAVRGELRCPEY